MMSVLATNGAKTGHYIMWHHVLQLPIHVSAELRKGLVFPWQCSRPHFVSTFELPQHASGNIVIATAGIGLVEHEGVDVHTKFVACLGVVLKPFHRQHQQPVGFHEDGTQVGKEAGL